MLKIETNKCEQQRQRDGCGDNQSGTNVVEEKYENHDHQQHAAQQVALHGLRCQLDQIAAVVERQNFDVLGQDFFVELLGLRFNPLQDVLSFFARPQQDDALHGVVLCLIAELTKPRGYTDHHTPDVLYQHRVAVMDRQHHVADVLQGIEPPQAAHVIELAAL